MTSDKIVPFPAKIQVLRKNIYVLLKQFCKKQVSSTNRMKPVTGEYYLASSVITGVESHFYLFFSSITPSHLTHFTY